MLDTCKPADQIGAKTAANKYTCQRNAVRNKWTQRTASQLRLTPGLAAQLLNMPVDTVKKNDPLTQTHPT